MEDQHPSLQAMVLVLLTNAVAVCLYFHFLQSKYVDAVDHDVLNRKVVDIPLISENCCSWWPLSHFIAFTIYSYIWPQYSWYLFGAGILWEVFEGILNIYYQRDKEEVRHQTTRNGDKVEYVTWWTASYKDVLFNTAGILVGRLMRVRGA
jgi:hypothetical protein